MRGRGRIWKERNPQKRSEKGGYEGAKSGRRKGQDRMRETLGERAEVGERMRQGKWQSYRGNVGLNCFIELVIGTH